MLSSSKSKFILPFNYIGLILVVFEFQLNQKIANYLVEGYTSITNNNNGNNNTPFWNKPGCHKLGHTREISIAGCVKFNLSTSACRGYCMSYSIPATEEHNLLTENSLVFNEVYDDAGFTELPYEIISTSTQQNNDESINNNQELVHFQQQQQQQQHQKARTLHNSREKSQQLQRLLSQNQQHVAGNDNNTLTNNQQQSTWRQITTYMASTLAPFTNNNYHDATNKQSINNNNNNNIGQPTTTVRTISSTGASLNGQSQQQLQSSGIVTMEGDEPLIRDVVSVSQCCNMMETEDVIVNLRCGVNETRRFKFKSAKTCECFFCYHV